MNRLQLLALLASLTLTLCGCASTRPQKGGKAITSPRQAAGVDQTLTQGENPSVANPRQATPIRGYPRQSAVIRAIFS